MIVEFEAGGVPMVGITGLVLAGGRATRMGGKDKGLIQVCGKPMVAHVLERLHPQVDALMINANRSLETYRLHGVPVVADSFGEYAGPLAGMAAGMEAARTELICTVPCDSPLVPAGLVARLNAARVDAGVDIAVAMASGRLQPVFAMIPVALLDDLMAYLVAGERKIDRWYRRHRMVEVDFSDQPEAFLNVNTPEERDTLEQRLRDGDFHTGGAA